MCASGRSMTRWQRSWWSERVRSRTESTSTTIYSGNGIYTEDQTDPPRAHVARCCVRRQGLSFIALTRPWPARSRPSPRRARNTVFARALTGRIERGGRDVLWDFAAARGGRPRVRRTRDTEVVRLVRRLRTEGNRRLLRLAGLPRPGADGGRGRTVRSDRRHAARARVRHAAGRRDAGDRDDQRDRLGDIQEGFHARFRARDRLPDDRRVARGNRPRPVLDRPRDRVGGQH